MNQAEVNKASQVEVVKLAKVGFTTKYLLMRGEEEIGVLALVESEKDGKLVWVSPSGDWQK